MKIKNKKNTKKCVIKRKLKFQHFKNCLEVAQTKNKINHLDKNKTDIDSLKEFVKNNKVISITQQRFKTERYNVFTEKINKIALSSNDDKIIQSIDSIETYVHEASKDLVCKKEEIKCNNIIKQCLTLIVLKKKIIEHNPNWPEIPDHPFRILITGGSGSGKTNALLKLLNNEPDIDKFILNQKI